MAISIQNSSVRQLTAPSLASGDRSAPGSSASPIRTAPWGPAASSRRLRAVVCATNRFPAATAAPVARKPPPPHRPGHRRRCCACSSTHRCLQHPSCSSPQRRASVRSHGLVRVLKRRLVLVDTLLDRAGRAQLGTRRLLAGGDELDPHWWRRLLASPARQRVHCGDREGVHRSALHEHVVMLGRWSGRLDSNQRPPAPKLTSAHPNSRADIDHFPRIYSRPLTCSATHVHAPESTLEHRVSRLARPFRSPWRHHRHRVTPGVRQ